MPAIDLKSQASHGDSDQGKDKRWQKDRGQACSLDENGTNGVRQYSQRKPFNDGLAPIGKVSVTEKDTGKHGKGQGYSIYYAVGRMHANGTAGAQDGDAAPGDVSAEKQQ